MIRNSPATGNRTELERLQNAQEGPWPDKVGPTDLEPLGLECQRLQMARRIVVARRARNELFDRPIFGEPGWDMLLDLYLGETSGAFSNISQLPSTEDIPRPTASRWLKFLEDEGLIRRDWHADVSSELVELTVRGQASVERYLDELRGL